MSLRTKKFAVSSSFMVVDSDGRIIADCLPLKGVDLPELSTTIEEATANATLFAKAPVMLDTIADVIAYIKKYNLQGTHIKNMLGTLKSAIEGIE